MRPIGEICPECVVELPTLGVAADVRHRAPGIAPVRIPTAIVEVPSEAPADSR
jgi:hypothetical protein